MSEHSSTLDAPGNDAEDLEANAGRIGRFLISALDKAVSTQSSLITGYVDRLRDKNPDASPSDIQEKLDQHFRLLTSGTGASAGAAAAIPGIGFATGTAAIGAESLVFLDAAAFYVTASAYLRGADIRDKEVRRGLVLVVLLGAKGTAIVESFVGDIAASSAIPTAMRFSNLRSSTLSRVNNRLAKSAVKRVTRRLGKSWLGKIMPFGIGAVVGALANRKMASQVLENTRDALGPVPASFAPQEPAEATSPAESIEA